VTKRKDTTLTKGSVTAWVGEMCRVSNILKNKRVTKKLMWFQGLVQYKQSSKIKIVQISGYTCHFIQLYWSNKTSHLKRC
jgi:hypothetical protein